MGSPITFSGFNQIDFNMILNAVMQQERAPLTRLETQKKSLETQNTTFGTFLGRLTALESAVKDLAKVDSLAKLAATSSDTGVGVSTTSGTVEGTYDVVVSKLARAQVTASTSSYASVDAAVATGGTLSLLRANQPPVDIVVTGSMTLRQLADAINARSDAPVTASVVQAAPGNYRLVLTGRSTGAEHAFTMTSSLTGGEGLTFADDGNGIYGEAADSNTQAAQNAEFTVNNLPIVSASNTVQDVIPGVTMTLAQEDAAKTVTVRVTRDNSEVTKLLDKFVTSYNDLVTFIGEQHTAAASGKTSIARDPLVRSLRDGLRQALQSVYAEGGEYSRVAMTGIEFEVGGKISLDKDALADALKDSPAAIQKLFAGAGGNGGIFGSLGTLLKEYTQAGGHVASVRQRLNDQVSNLSKRLDTLEAQLAIRRNALQQEFIAADMAMTQLRAQSGPLAALGGQYRLF